MLLHEIAPVLGASKYEQQPIDAPSSVTVITAEEIRTYGYRTLADVLRSVRGFFVTYDRNYSYVGVRGFGRPGDYNTRILLLLDGQRVNDNIYDSALIGTESIVNLDIVDSIEVVRGPSSSLYGTNAFFAVVNVLTKNGRALKGIVASADGGSFGTWHGAAAYGNRIGNDIDLVVSGSAYDSRGQRHFFEEFDGRNGSDGWTGKTDGDKTEKAQVKASRGDFTLEGAFSTRTKEIPTASFGTDFGSSSEKTRDDIGFVAIEFAHDLGSERKVEARLSYNYYYYHGDYPIAGIINRDVSDGRWWGLEGSAIQPIGDRQKVIAGFEFRDNVEQNQLNLDLDPRHVYLDSKRDSSNGALYSQDEIRIGERLIVNAGIRYDHSDSFGNTTSPRVAVIWRTGNETALKLLVGRAFRAPTAYELFYGTPGSDQKANPDLRPETVRSAELVLESALGRFHVTGALYHYFLRDLINLEVDPSDGFLQYRNVDRVKATGLELELQGSFARHLEGRISSSFQESRDELTDRLLSNSPRCLTKLSLSSRLLRDRLTAALDAQYTSNTRSVSGAMTGASTVFNVGLSARPWQTKVELEAWIYNLTGERYFNSGGEEHAQKLIQQDGRSYRVGIKYEF